MVLLWTHASKPERDANQKRVTKSTKLLKKKRVSKKDVTHEASKICASVSNPILDETREQASGSNSFVFWFLCFV